ncbi:cobalamin-binding protein [candidate division WOR-3 bacterium]|nr:cobalamin-binding protein [candidate division WOR-3 bacterium]
MLVSTRKAILSAGLLVLCLASCAQDEKKSHYRIVSLSPAMTEILFSIGAGDKIVGVTTFCDFPEETRNITKVGDFSHPSIERIIGLKPDLVIVNLPEQSRVKRELEKMNVRTFVSSPASLSELYSELSALGAELGLQKTADSLVSYIKDNLQAEVSSEPKRVYVEISPRPLVTIGSATFLNDLIHMAGGVNIFADLDKDYPVVGQEAVITRDPDIIIVLHPEDITGRTGWQNVRAIKDGRVRTDLDPDHLMRPGPRLVRGFKQLKAAIND